MPLYSTLSDAAQLGLKRPKASGAVSALNSGELKRKFGNGCLRAVSLGLSKHFARGQDSRVVHPSTTAGDVNECARC